MNIGNLDHSGEQGVSHSGYRWLHSGMAPPCDKCLVHEYLKERGEGGCPFYESGATCQVVAEEQERLEQELMQRADIEPAAFPLVAEYVRTSIFLNICARWLGIVGPLVVKKDKTIDVQPILKVYGTYQGQLRRLADALGLSPAARARMGAAEKSSDLVKAIIAVEEEDSSEADSGDNSKVAR